MLKRVSDFNKENMKGLSVEEINHLTDAEQAEAIVDSFNKISKEYEEVNAEDIKIPPISAESIPEFSPLQIKKYLERIKTNKAALSGDIPA